MKAIGTALTLSVLLVSAASAADLFAGTWKEDLSKSSNNWNEKPTVARTRTYTATGKGTYDIKIDRVDENGKPVSTTLKGGGNVEIPYTGNTTGLRQLAATHVISRWVDDHTMTATYRRNGKDVATSTSKISADGHTLTMTLAGTTPDGKPIKSTSVYHK